MQHKSKRNSSTPGCKAGDYCRDKVTGKCSYGFPKPVQEKTFFDGAKWHIKRNFEDRWTVLHNRYLLLKFNTHVCVLPVTGGALISYLFKYVLKGPLENVDINIYESNDEENSTTNNNNNNNSFSMSENTEDFDLDEMIQLNESNDGLMTDQEISRAEGDEESTKRIKIDEVKEWVKMSYIPSSQAFDRIFGFRCHYRNTTVVTISCQLPGDYYKTFDIGDKVDDTTGQLEKYFLRPKDKKFDDITPLDFFELYYIKRRSDFKNSNSKKNKDDHNSDSFFTVDELPNVEENSTTNDRITDDSEDEVFTCDILDCLDEIESFEEKLENGEILSTLELLKFQELRKKSRNRVILFF